MPLREDVYPSLWVHLARDPLLLRSWIRASWAHGLTAWGSLGQRSRGSFPLVEASPWSALSPNPSGDPAFWSQPLLTTGAFSLVASRP